MKKLLITTALLFTALPFTFDGATPTISKAHAIIGRPLTPFSVAGVHRRAMRRTYGLGWRGGVGGYGFRHPVAAAAIYRHRRFGYGYGFRHPIAAAAIYRHRRFAYGYHPLARAAVVGAAAATGAGYYGAGYGGGAPLYAYAGAAPGWGGGWGGWGWNRPLFGAGLGWGGGWGGWGRRWW
jgi:hypothetical protein